MSQEFLEAVKSGDVVTVENLLEADPALASARTETGESALLVAAYYGQPEIAGTLLAWGAEPSIFEAAALGLSRRLPALLAAQPELAGAFSSDGWTPLHLAAYFGRLEAAETLLAHGADPHARSKNDTNNTPLGAAVAGGRLEAARLLLERGADVNARQADGAPPLYIAAFNGQADMVTLLLAHGAAVNARTSEGQTPLAAARDRDHAIVAEMLSRQGGTAVRDKAALLGEIRTEHARLEDLLSGLSEAQLSEPGVQDGWSVKDILAHLAAWEWRLVAWLQAAARGEIPERPEPGATWADMDRLNEQTLAQSRARPAGEILADFRAAFGQVVQAVEALSEAELAEPDHFAWTSGHTLWPYIASNTYEHYQEHLEAIQAWLDR